MARDTLERYLIQGITVEPKETTEEIRAALFKEEDVDGTSPWENHPSPRPARHAAERRHHAGAEAAAEFEGPTNPQPGLHPEVLRHLEGAMSAAYHHGSSNGQKDRTYWAQMSDKHHDLLKAAILHHHGPHRK